MRATFVIADKWLALLFTLFHSPLGAKFQLLYYWRRHQYKVCIRAVCAPVYGTTKATNRCIQSGVFTLANIDFIFAVVLINWIVVWHIQSDAPNWEAKDCVSHHKKEHVVTSLEDELLKALKKEPITIATQLNKNEVGRWHVLLEVLKSYKTAGIQVIHKYYTFSCKQC